ncbi:MAG: hypothetical protein ACRCXZ_03395 [Patescibacteria group bacterium]
MSNVIIQRRKIATPDQGKTIFRAAFSGPFSKKYDPSQLLGYLDAYFAMIEYDLDLTTIQIMLCAGGTDAGFMEVAYRFAQEKGYLTAGYLTSKADQPKFLENYSIFPCDELIYAVPENGQNSTWYDVSEVFVNDANEHILLCTLDSGMEISLHEYQLAQARQTNDKTGEFRSRQLNLATWD